MSRHRSMPAHKRPAHRTHCRSGATSTPGCTRRRPSAAASAARADTPRSPAATGPAAVVVRPAAKTCSRRNPGRQCVSSDPQLRWRLQPVQSMPGKTAPACLSTAVRLPCMLRRNRRLKMRKCTSGDCVGWQSCAAHGVWWLRRLQRIDARRYLSHCRGWPATTPASRQRRPYGPQKPAGACVSLAITQMKYLLLLRDGRRLRN